MNYPQWQPAEEPAVLSAGAEAFALDYAPTLHRILARLLDVLVHLVSGFFALIWIGVFAALFFRGVSNAFLATLGSNKLVAIVFGLLGMTAYHTCMEGLHGSTIGKRLLGLQVLKDDGESCSLAQAAKRSLAILWDGLFFGLIGIVAMNGCPQRQRNGDDWAGTVVVRRASVPPAAQRSGKELFAALLLAIVADMLFLSMGHLTTYALG
ncbi:MAG: RDD family protein [Acidobacteriota bacterium]